MKLAIKTTAVIFAMGFATTLSAATYQTANFEVKADSFRLAEEVARSAEEWRARLAQYWLGRPLDDWTYTCRIDVRTQKSGGTGWTTYHLLGGKIVRVGIRLDGAPEQLLEYVLPHELTHAVLATATGKPMPRWADEGAAMLSESESQKLRQQLVVKQLINTGDMIPLRQLLGTIDYPPSRSKLYAFYAQSLLLSEFLIDRGGRERFLKFVRDGHTGEWDVALHQHYELENVEALQGAWSEWVLTKPGNRIVRDTQHIASAATVGE